MISRLRGKLVGRTSEGLVLDVSGVGYLVAATPAVLRQQFQGALHRRRGLVTIYNLFHSSGEMPTSRMMARINPTLMSFPWCMGMGMICLVSTLTICMWRPPGNGPSKPSLRSLRITSRDLSGESFGILFFDDNAINSGNRPT